MAASIHWAAAGEPNDNALKACQLARARDEIYG
jgi:hypothetical protein